MTDAQLLSSAARLLAVLDRDPDPCAHVTLWAALSARLDSRQPAYTPAERRLVEAFLAALIPQPTLDEELAALPLASEGEEDVGAL